MSERAYKLLIAILLTLCVFTVPAAVKKAINHETVYLVTGYGDSMEPTLKSGDTYIMIASDSNVYERGDIVSFSSENIDPKYHAGDNGMVKRIVAIPGDVVTVENRGITYVNGESIQLENEKGCKYLKNTSYTITLGEDEYFMVGDNRDVSMDSRYFGPIKLEDIKAKYYPDRQEVPSSFFDKLFNRQK